MEIVNVLLLVVLVLSVEYFTRLVKKEFGAHDNQDKQQTSRPLYLLESPISQMVTDNPLEILKGNVSEMKVEVEQIEVEVEKKNIKEPQKNAVLSHYRHRLELTKNALAKSSLSTDFQWRDQNRFTQYMDMLDRVYTPINEHLHVLNSQLQDINVDLAFTHNKELEKERVRLVKQIEKTKAIISSFFEYLHSGDNEIKRSLSARMSVLAQAQFGAISLELKSSSFISLTAMNHWMNAVLYKPRARVVLDDLGQLAFTFAS
jgi:cell division protein FtsI/penicillin-binding protein 2